MRNGGEETNANGSARGGEPGRTAVAHGVCTMVNGLGALIRRSASGCTERGTAAGGGGLYTLQVQL